jgi:sulfatase maturation enzyme AslB (radical SAM superfamily)
MQNKTVTLINNNFNSQNILNEFVINFLEKEKNVIINIITENKNFYYPFIESNKNINVFYFDNEQIKDILTQSKIIIFDDWSLSEILDILGIVCIYIGRINNDDGSFIFGVSKLYKIIFNSIEHNNEMLKKLIHTVKENIYSKKQQIKMVDRKYRISKNVVQYKYNENLILLNMKNRNPLIINNKNNIIFDYLNTEFKAKKEYNLLKVDEKRIISNLFLKHEIIKTSHKATKLNKILYTDVKYEKNNIDAEIQLFTTKQCNFDCKYCYLKKENTIECMTEDIALKSIQRHIAYYYDLNIKINKYTIFIIGAEPLIIWNIIKKIVVKINNYFKNNYPEIDYKFSLSTNLNLLNDEILYDIKNFNIELHISLDGYKVEHFQNRTNNKKDISIIIENVKKIKLNDIPFILACTISKANQYDLINISEYLLDLGSKILKIFPIQINFDNPIFYDENILAEILPDVDLIKNIFKEINERKIVSIQNNSYLRKFDVYFETNNENIYDIACLKKNTDKNNYIDHKGNKYFCDKICNDTTIKLSKKNIFCPFNKFCAYRFLCLKMCIYDFVNLNTRKNISKIVINYLNKIHCELNIYLFETILLDRSRKFIMSKGE